MSSLKLIALDAEDLAVVSAHVQDGVLKVADMMFDRRGKRFAAVFNRFDWSDALGVMADGASDAKSKTEYRRVQSALRFDRVHSAKVQGIDLTAGGSVLSLLALQFTPAGPDRLDGSVLIQFSGNSAIKLEVECIEAELKDLGPAWQANGLPAHQGAADASQAHTQNSNSD